MATLMDWLLQRQARGYSAPTDSAGPGVLEILSQGAARGYPESPEMYAYRTGSQLPPGYAGGAGRALAGASLSQQPQPGYSGDAGRQLAGALLAQQPQPGYAPYPEEPGYSGAAGRRLAGAVMAQQPQPGYQNFNFNQLPGYEGEGVQGRAASAMQGRQVSQAPMGPVNMNVIKGLNQYAQMGDAQAYADQFAKGDLSKVKARTYRNEDGTTWNDYYVSGLLGG